MYVVKFITTPFRILLRNLQYLELFSQLLYVSIFLAYLLYDSSLLTHSYDSSLSIRQSLQDSLAMARPYIELRTFQSSEYSPFQPYLYKLEKACLFNPFTSFSSVQLPCNISVINALPDITPQALLFKIIAVSLSQQTLIIKISSFNTLLEVERNESQSRLQSNLDQLHSRLAFLIIMVCSILLMLIVALTDCFIIFNLTDILLVVTLLLNLIWLFLQISTISFLFQITEMDSAHELIRLYPAKSLENQLSYSHSAEEFQLFNYITISYILVKLISERCQILYTISNVIYRTLPAFLSAGFLLLLYALIFNFVLVLFDSNTLNFDSQITIFFTLESWLCEDWLDCIKVWLNNIVYQLVILHFTATIIVAFRASYEIQLNYKSQCKLEIDESIQQILLSVKKAAKELLIVNEKPHLQNVTVWFQLDDNYLSIASSKISFIKLNSITHYRVVTEFIHSIIKLRPSLIYASQGEFRMIIEFSDRLNEQAGEQLRGVLRLLSQIGGECQVFILVKESEQGQGLDDQFGEYTNVKKSGCYQQLQDFLFQNQSRCEFTPRPT